MLYHDPAAKTHDRIGFTLSIAIAMHVAVILGVGFALAIPKTPTTTRMDITLSSYATDKKIYDADFVAQTNQEASGSQSDKAELKTTEIAPINDSTIKPVQQVIELPRQQQKKSQALEVVTTTADSRDPARLKQLEQEKKKLLEELEGDKERLRRLTEMAALQAKLDKEQQVYARLPRIRRATSVATKAADDAEYLFKWQRRIEAIGNQHYPDEAKRQKLYGDVRVLVSINSDGSLRSVRILQSSGIKILDNAALKIVRLASPYDPFPPAIRKDTDVLEIVRTWQFRKNRFEEAD